jgi:molybdate transport system ATP-binding protein
MSLAVAIRHRLGAFDLEASFESQGRLTALFGASGSGKTSLVNIVAGLVSPGFARIAVDGQVLTDTARGISIPVHRRRIGYVFQEARLFPHLSVAQNLTYGRWFAPRGDRYVDMAQVTRLLGLAPLLLRRPAELSGGERQRVAIGRALLASPRLLLMDEPLASLDQPRKAEIIPFIERLRDELRIPILYVSHSVAEVTRLATDIVVMAGGRSIAAGSAAEIMERLDLLPGDERDEGGVVLDMVVAGHDARYDMTSLEGQGVTIRVPGETAGPGTRTRVRIRARDVMVATEAPRNISALNILPGTVVATEPEGASSVHVRIRCGEAVVLARITRQSHAALGLAPGSRAFAVIKAVSVAEPSAAPRSAGS